MALANTPFELLKKTSHKFPKKLYRLVNESFEIIRGAISSIKSNSKEITNTQRQLLKQNYSSETRGLIIFLTPGVDIVNGGILSITSLYKESGRLKNIHGCEVILCTYPSDPSLLKYTKFRNGNYLYSFSDTLRYFRNLEKLIIQIPEHFIYRFNWFLTRTDRDLLSKIKNVQINVMIQNIDQLPSLKTIYKLRSYGWLTSTTAHSKYSTLQLRNRLGFPLHKLSVFNSPEQYYSKPYNEKENLMIISPDKHSLRETVLDLIQTQLPSLALKVIKNLTYEEYKETISRAKWALTFGEGLDGYFVETIFSGGVSFSVYNNKFFTENFRTLQTVYSNYDALIKNISRDIAQLDNPESYTKYQRIQFSLCASIYDSKIYEKNLEAFYRGDYTFK